jgi:hypothetical protein
LAATLMRDRETLGWEVREVDHPHERGSRGVRGRDRIRRRWGVRIASWDRARARTAAGDEQEAARPQGDVTSQGRLLRSANVSLG